MICKIARERCEDEERAKAIINSLMESNTEKLKHTIRHSKLVEEVECHIAQANTAWEMTSYEAKEKGEKREADTELPLRNLVTHANQIQDYPPLGDLSDEHVAGRDAENIPTPVVVAAKAKATLLTATEQMSCEAKEKGIKATVTPRLIPSKAVTIPLPIPLPEPEERNARKGKGVVQVEGNLPRNVMVMHCSNETKGACLEQGVVA